ncbi:hypothetical protein ACFO0N_21015 [Halobium salinum]|uniref:Uncharacterized protein n=1 Tax=Halobium salinum TaxID=1364940 RepID=A0ABD5PIB1_9EURY|nr:hypothetical protein [Halobium salinum]
MVEIEILVNAVTLVVVLVVFTFVSIAFYRTRIRRLLVLLLLSALLGVNMVVSIAEDLLEGTIPFIEVFTSLLSLGIALLLLITLMRQFSWEPR